MYTREVDPYVAVRIEPLKRGVILGKKLFSPMSYTSVHINWPLRLVGVILLVSLMGCQGAPPDVKSLPAQTERGYHMVVEIPAGTNLKMEYDAERNRIVPDQINGEDRRIAFLPYPGNYGFIPGTRMDRARGGDGDALDVLLISEQLPGGSVVEILPLGMLELADAGAIDTKIIATPADPADRLLAATTFQEFYIEYDAARRIIEEWFLHYKGFGQMELMGWKDEAAARAYIGEWIE